MAGKLEYHFCVRRLIPASVAGFAAVVLLGLSPAMAQVHGVPTSVTSIGFGGHFDRIPGTRPSVTSLGPRGFNDPSHTFAPFGVAPRPQPTFMHRHRRQERFPGVGEVYAVPYYVPTYIVDQSEDNSETEANYPSGPTIFDRRASGESSQTAETAYLERLRSELRQEQAAEPTPPPVPSTEESAPVANEPATVLVFKDGHQLEVQNYAIVGSTLFDLTPGHRSKIALADLDLASTAKQNDDRGIDFQLPKPTN